MIKKIWDWMTEVIGAAGVILLISLIVILTVVLTLISIFVTLGSLAAPFILSMLAWSWIFG